MDYVFIIIVTSVFLAISFFASLRAKSIKITDDGFVLKYPVGHKVLFICLPACFIGIPIYLSFSQPIETNIERWAYKIMFLLAFLLLDCFYIEFFTVKIFVGSSGITGTTGWRGKRNYTWSEIQEITFSPTCMWFKISAKDKVPLRIHVLISGINQFQEMVVKYLPEKIWSDAFDNFNKAADKRLNPDR